VAQASPALKRCSRAALDPLPYKFQYASPFALSLSKGIAARLRIFSRRNKRYAPDAALPP